MKDRAVVFDFDGTLLNTGPDKGVHVMYSAWVACYAHGYGDLLHPADPERDVENMLKAYSAYPGAPRFEQLSAVINGLINRRYEAVANPGELGLPPQLTERYSGIRREYNTLYSGLNDTAARMYWKPFPSVNEVLVRLRENHDLYVASGVIQDLLEIDFDHHQFDRSLFLGIFGSDRKGIRNKGVVLNEIKSKGYSGMLFVGDSTKDQEYAVEAGVRFFRITADADYRRLISSDPFEVPDEKDPWVYSNEEMRFYHEKTSHLVASYGSGHPMTHEEICEWINSR